MIGSLLLLFVSAISHSCLQSEIIHETVHFVLALVWFCNSIMLTSTPVWCIVPMHRVRYLPTQKNKHCPQNMHTILLLNRWHRIGNYGLFSRCMCTVGPKITVYRIIIIISSSSSINHVPLIHLALDKMAAILKTTFSNAFSWMKVLFCDLNFLRVQLTTTQHWFR